MTLAKHITSNNLVKDKQANVSKISLFILPRPNTSILAKLKFFKKTNVNSQTKISLILKP